MTLDSAGRLSNDQLEERKSIWGEFSPQGYWGLTVHIYFINARHTKRVEVFWGGWVFCYLFLLSRIARVTFNVDCKFPFCVVVSFCFAFIRVGNGCQLCVIVERLFKVALYCI